ncbi:MAG: hypothetical protein B6229_05395 [Spirochaetaceae bacterium 4572_7]|nr:MAG: hypothetical protein B6229_05395 [Spirochaetaceae bacterium 4572_7]
MFNRRLVLILIIVASFVISLFFFFRNDTRYTKVTYQFYNELSGDLVNESRYILWEESDKRMSIKIVDELFLGPISVFNKKLAPFDISYNSFYVRNKIAYIDLPIEFVTNFNDKEYAIDEIVDIIKSNIKHNIKKINQVILTINGHLIGIGVDNMEFPQELDDNK